MAKKLPCCLDFKKNKPKLYVHLDNMLIYVQLYPVVG